MNLADSLHNTDRYSRAVEQDMENIQQALSHRYFQTILGNLGETPLNIRQQQLDEVMSDLNANFITRYFFGKQFLFFP